MMLSRLQLVPANKQLGLGDRACRVADYLLDHLTYRCAVCQAACFEVTRKHHCPSSESHRPILDVVSLIDIWLYTLDHIGSLDRLIDGLIYWGLTALSAQ